MIPTQLAPPAAPERSPVLLTVLIMLVALCIGGCSASSTGREAYYSSRADVVMFSQGSGHTRVSMWPDSPFGDDLALADSDSQSTRPRVALEH